MNAMPQQGTVSMPDTPHGPILPSEASTAPSVDSEL